MRLVVIVPPFVRQLLGFLELPQYGDIQRSHSFGDSLPDNFLFRSQECIKERREI